HADAGQAGHQFAPRNPVVEVLLDQLLHQSPPDRRLSLGGPKASGLFGSPITGRLSPPLRGPKGLNRRSPTWDRTHAAGAIGGPMSSPHEANRRRKVRFELSLRYIDRTAVIESDHFATKSDLTVVRLH